MEIQDDLKQISKKTVKTKGENRTYYLYRKSLKNIQNQTSNEAIQYSSRFRDKGPVFRKKCLLNMYDEYCVRCETGNILIKPPGS